MSLTVTHPNESCKVGPIRRGVGLVVCLILMVVGLEFAVGNVQSFKVISRSMDPTLQIGDYVLILRNADHGEDVREKVIAFEPEDAGTAITKRVIAHQGETVDLKEGQLFVDGEQERPGYGPIHLRQPRSWKLTQSELFVVGDNRNYSYDSIDHGPIARARLVGVVALRYWPPGRIGAVN